MDNTTAPGRPGLTPTWTSGAKDLVTTAIAGRSRVWATVGRGIGTEIFWPSTGRPQVRDVGFIVAGPDGWVEVKDLDRYRLDDDFAVMLIPRVLHEGPGWQLRLDWIVDPDRDVVLIEHTLTVDDPKSADDYHLYVLAAPQLDSGTRTSSARWDHDLVAVADGAPVAVALATTGGFARASVGYVGVSDGWQDFNRNGAMTWEYRSAPNGTVALTGELRPGGTLAIGLAPSAEGAQMLARSALAEGVEPIRRRFEQGWQDFADHLDLDGVEPQHHDAVIRSAAVLACHEDRTYPGAAVASLSVPWGDTGHDLGGYHLVWPRDMVESALALLAVGDRPAALRTLRWLCAAQQPDGHWAQNSYADGRPYWSGLQLDETALPIVLAATLGIAPDDESVRPMVRRAAHYLAVNGPVSPQDRWEENPGVNAFTLATVIAALTVAEPWLTAEEAQYCLTMADYWNARIEDWLYADGGALAAEHKVDGYYVRMSDADHLSPTDDMDAIWIRNRVGVDLRADRVVACDPMALVRFGLRRADEQRMIDTVTVIDDLLCDHLPNGIVYRRYTADGYGEHDDGSAYDGTGIGRAWPLLTGERGHYELQAGRSAERYLESMMAMTGPGGMMPEQVWNAADVPERGLFTGRPTGSAMPLAWCHGEFIKLATLATRGTPIELLPAVADRHRDSPRGHTWVWRPDVPVTSLPDGHDLIIDLDRAFELRLDNGEAMSSEPAAFGRHQVWLETPEPFSGLLVPDNGDEPTRVDVQRQ